MITGGGHYATGYAHFYYNKNGKLIPGEVVCNFWEQKGDMIKIAYTPQNKVFRADVIIIDDQDFLVIIDIIIVMICVIFYKRGGD